MEKTQSVRTATGQSARKRRPSSTSSHKQTVLALKSCRKSISIAAAAIERRRLTPPTYRGYDFVDVCERYKNVDARAQQPVRAGASVPMLSTFAVCVKLEDMFCNEITGSVPSREYYLSNMPRNDVLVYAMFGTGTAHKTYAEMFSPLELTKLMEAVFSYPLEWSPFWEDADAPEWFSRTIGTDSFRSLPFDEAFKVAAETLKFCSEIQFTRKIHRPSVDELQAVEKDQLMQHTFRRFIGHKRVQEYSAGWGCYIYQSDAPYCSSNLRPIL
uniref:Protein ORF109 n=1 Tax=Cyprinid herpesvirus 2 TaxID=317878 RepID=A0A6H0QZK5_CYHV2